MTTLPSYTLGLSIPVFVTGIVGNLLLIVAHVKDPLKLIKSSSSCFIFNIAFVDLVFSCASFAVMILSFANIRHLETVVLILILYTVHVSFALYLSLAIERYCSVVYPLWHRVKITARVCHLWVFGIWSGGILLVVGYVILMTKTGSEFHTDFVIVPSMWLMTVLTQYIYLASIISIRKQSREFQRRQGMNGGNETAIIIRMKNEKNFIALIAIVSFIQQVLACTLYTTAQLRTADNDMTWSENDYKNVALSDYSWDLLGLGVNSAINVLVYIWRLPKYRRTFKKLYCDCCNKRHPAVQAHSMRFNGTSNITTRL